MIKAVDSVFKLDYQKLLEDLAFQGIVKSLNSLPRIDSQKSFNIYCQSACRLWLEYFPNSRGTTTSFFQRLVNQSFKKHSGKEIIVTSWGVIVIVQNRANFIEKYLVINKGGYLPLEKHEEKIENLCVIEGCGLMLSRVDSKQSLQVQELLPGFQITFMPGIEHCVIGTEDLLILEKSNDPKGMDKDLIFIYTPSSL